MGALRGRHGPVHMKSRKKAYRMPRYETHPYLLAWKPKIVWVPLANDVVLST
jgi:hypothetical protein